MGGIHFPLLNITNMMNPDYKLHYSFYSKAFPTWCWILTVSEEDQPLLQEIISHMLDNDKSLELWNRGEYFNYFNLLYEDQGELAGIREYGYWVLTKHMGIKTYDEYLDKYDEISKSNFLNMGGTL